MGRCTRSNLRRAEEARLASAAPCRRRRRGRASARRRRVLARVDHSARRPAPTAGAVLPSERHRLQRARPRDVLEHRLLRQRLADARRRARRARTGSTRRTSDTSHVRVRARSGEALRRVERRRGPPRSTSSTSSRRPRTPRRTPPTTRWMRPPLADDDAPPPPSESAFMSGARRRSARRAGVVAVHGRPAPSSSPARRRAPLPIPAPASRGSPEEQDRLFGGRNGRAFAGSPVCVLPRSACVSIACRPPPRGIPRRRRRRGLRAVGRARTRLRFAARCGRAAKPGGCRPSS